VRGGRARGGRRVPEVDPVVLLSSEDEAEGGEGTSDSSNVSYSCQLLSMTCIYLLFRYLLQQPTINSKLNSNGNLHELSAAFPCEPNLPEIDEEPLYKGRI